MIANDQALTMVRLIERFRFMKRRMTWVENHLRHRVTICDETTDDAVEAGICEAVTAAYGPMDQGPYEKEPAAGSWLTLAHMVQRSFGSVRLVVLYTNSEEIAVFAALNRERIL